MQVPGTGRMGRRRKLGERARDHAYGRPQCARVWDEVLEVDASRGMRLEETYDMDLSLACALDAGTGEL